MKKFARCSGLPEASHAIATTVEIGRFFNGAPISVAGGVIMASNDHLASHGKYGCSRALRVSLSMLSCGSQQRADRAVVTHLAPAEPERMCTDQRNWRSNGPEDARLLLLSKHRLLLLYGDYYCGSGRGSCARTMFMRVLDLRLLFQTGATSRTLEFAAQRLRPAKASGSFMSELEKNWVPFCLDHDECYVQQWLDSCPASTFQCKHALASSPMSGHAVTIRVNLTTGVRCRFRACVSTQACVPLLYSCASQSRSQPCSVRRVQHSALLN